MSTFSCPVVEISAFGKHPNADTLSIISIEGCPCIFRTGDFNVGDKAVYVPVESVVPLTHPLFAFLRTGEGEHARIKAKKLRGIFSMGILVKAPDGLEIGQDASGVLGIVKYEEAEDIKLQTSGAKPPGTKVPPPHYDMESYRKFKGAVPVGAEVVVTEKIHGCNSRFVFHDGALHCGSHNGWKKDEIGCMWWAIARQYGLAERLKNYPDYVFYGESYGWVQDLRYGQQQGRVKLAIFDIFDALNGTWLSWTRLVQICAALDLPTVPVLYSGPFNDPESVENLRNGPSMVPGANNIREGVVIKTVEPQYDRNLGRVIVKLVGEDYMLRKGGTERH